MTFRFASLRALALVAALPLAAVSGQQIGQLPRTTPTTGLADSALFLCTDSTKVTTRACKFSDVQKRLAFKNFDSIKVTGPIRASGGFAGIADSATGAARSQILTTARTIGGVSFNGSANIIPDSATGSARSQKLTTARTINGTSFDGSTNVTVTAAAATLTGTSLASGVTGSSLTSFGVGARTDSATGAARAQTLTTARALWGQSFDGSANITGKPAFASGLTVTGVDSLLAGSRLAFAVNDTVYGQPIWNATQTFANAQRVDSATGAARASALVGSPAITVSSCTGCATFPLLATNGTAAAPSYSFTNSTGLGEYRVGPDTLGFATGGVNRFSILTGGGGVENYLLGGPGNAVFQAGTGNSRQITFRATNGSGATVNSLQLSSTTATFGVNQSLVAGTAASPSIQLPNSTGAGFYGFGADTVGIATLGAHSIGIRGGASPTIFGGAGNMTIQSGTGASRTLTLQATNATSGTFNSLVLGADSTVTAIGRMVLKNSNNSVHNLQLNYSNSNFGMFFDVNNANIPSVTFREDVNGTQNQIAGANTDSTFRINGGGGERLITVHNQTGSVKTGGDSLLLNSTTIKAPGSTGATIIRGGTGSMTIQAGTGASRRLTFQTTTSGSTATTFLRANELQQSLFADGAVGTPGVSFASDSLLGLYRIGTAGASDTIMVAANGVNQMKIAPAGILRLPLLPAEGSTKNAMCWDGTTFNVTQNAAATCTVSSARFKENIAPIDAAAAWKIVSKPQLRSSSYNERVGGRLAIGIIAEQADSADTRLASRDAKGLITSTNYEEVTSLLLTIVKDQQRQLDSLKTVLKTITAPCKGPDCILVRKP